MTGCCCCFPDTQKILTQNGYIKISELKPSDKLIVLSRTRQNHLKLKQTLFYDFLHFDSKLVAKYLTIICENGAQLVVSGAHVLFRLLKNGKVEDVAASQIKVGDTLIYLDAGQNIVHPIVVEIKPEVEIEGAFAPLSKSGTLIVEGFMASCYAYLGSRSHVQAHTSLAPLRLWCKSGAKLSHLMDKSSKTQPEQVKEFQEGIHQYAKFLMTLRRNIRL